MTLLLSKQFLIPEQFWNTEEFPYEKSWNGETKILFGNVSWKKISTKNQDKPILSVNFFDTPNQGNIKRFSHEMFWYYETKNMDNIVILHLSKNFSIPERF